MQVKIKNFDVQMHIKKKGIELAVSDSGGKHLGDLVINQKYLTWCKGRTRRKTGKKINWDKFISIIQDHPGPNRHFNRKDGKYRRGLSQLDKNAWTPREIKRLRIDFRAMSASEIAAKMGRSLPSVRGKIASLGIKKNPVRQRSKSRAHDIGREWSKEELSMLRKYYLTQSATQIARELKRSHASVRGKIAALGLTKR